jgi:hypothetical protein
MAGLTGNVGIGCVTCHKFATKRRTACAKFSVCDPNMIKANKFLRHLRSASHLEAEARSLNGHPSYSESNKTQLGVPAPCKFVWSMQSCFNCASFRDWSKQNMQRDGLNEECLRDSSPNICKQLLFASSMPVTIQNQGLLQKAMRIALSVDDKDPAFLCRVKLVVTSPATQCLRLFGGLLEDCRHDADSTTTKILNIIDQLAMKRQGRRDASGITGPNDQMDEELKQQIRKTCFCCCSDGAEVMVKAIQQLKIGGHFPNLRFQFRDAAHSTTCVGQNAEHMQIQRMKLKNSSSLAKLLL